MTERVSVIGLGEGGLGLALSLAKAGVRTVGVDVRPERVADLQRGISPIVEPGYQETLTAVGASFLATLSVEEAVRDTEVTFMLAATSSADGRLVSEEVEAVAREAGRALRQTRKTQQLFVIGSPLSPGVTERRIIPALEDSSGRRMNRGFGVCYAPGVAEIGSVMHDLANPELLVIGESAPGAGQRVAALHARVAVSRPAISRMSIVSAEIARASRDAFIAMKIAFANTVANVCDVTPGADVDQITRAIGADRRISPQGLTGGMPFGGTYGTQMLRAACEALGEDGSLLAAVAASNDWQHARLAGMALALARPGGRIAILGMANEVGTPIVHDSAGSKLAQSLALTGHEVTTFDRLVPHGDQQALAGSIRVAASAAEALAGASVAVVAVPDSEYLRAVEMWRPVAPGTVLDCWRALDGRALDGLITRVSLGRGARGVDDVAIAA